MRRSTSITLTLLAGATMGLAFCHEIRSPEEGVVETEGACVDRLGTDAADECADIFQSARQAHASSAPHFATAEECRATTGSDCVVAVGDGTAADRPSVAGMFIPAMAGVMIGRAISNGMHGAVPVYAGAVPPACLPGAPSSGVCPPASGTSSGGGNGGSRFWYSGGSYAGYSDSGSRSGFRRASTSSAGASLLSRSASRSGGFGHSASAHSGHAS